MSLVFMSDEELQQQQIVMMRTCTTCKKTKPATLEYFYRQKNGKYGLSSKCKECKTKSHNAWYQNGAKRRFVIAIKMVAMRNGKGSVTKNHHTELLLMN